LWGAQNPRFFEGTVVAKEAAAVLAEPTLRAAAESQSPPTRSASARFPRPA